jgi:hypothetical protein
MSRDEQKNSLQSITGRLRIGSVAKLTAGRNCPFPNGNQVTPRKGVSTEMARTFPSLRCTCPTWPFRIMGIVS